MSVVGMSGIRNGKKIEIDGELFLVVYFQHVNPGKGQAFVKTKIKNMRTGQVLEKTFKGGDSIKLPEVTQKEMQYLYNDDQGFHFMDNNTYEQTFLSPEQIGGNSKWLQEGSSVQMLEHNGEIIDVDLPAHVELEVVHTDPGLKGDTSGGATKPATMEGGAIVQVPLFVNMGEKLRIDTRTGNYIERVK